MSGTRRSKWCAKLNYNGEVHEIWLYAKNEREAYRLALARLALILKLTSSRSLLPYFDGSKNNYEIKKIRPEEESSKAKPCAGMGTGAELE